MRDTPTAAERRVRDADQLPSFLQRAMEECGLSSCTGYSIVNVGYEDCNIDVQTADGRFMVKVFAVERTVGSAARTVTIIERAIAAGVSHPRLLRDKAGRSLHKDSVTGNEYIVMDFVEGSNFYDLGRPPSIDELRTIVHQASLIHSIDLYPPLVIDMWAIPNLAALNAQVSKYLQPRERALVQRVTDAMRRVDAASLPAVLIHGDMTKGNFIRTLDGGFTVLDFSVANRFPRIQELAVIAANLMYGDATPLLSRAQLVADLYTAHQPLSPSERQALTPYTCAAAAMEFLGAIYERRVNGNDSAETHYIIELGLAGLHAIGSEIDALM